jgi:hypothetical protein
MKLESTLQSADAYKWQATNLVWKHFHLYVANIILPVQYNIVPNKNIILPVQYNRGGMWTIFQLSREEKQHVSHAKS